MEKDRKTNRSYTLIRRRFDFLRVLRVAGRKRGHRLWLAVCDRFCDGKTRLCRTQDLTGGQLIACVACTKIHQRENLQRAWRIRRERQLAEAQ